jgi:hypothetical protein
MGQAFTGKPIIDIRHMSFEDSITDYLMSEFKGDYRLKVTRPQQAKMYNEATHWAKIDTDAIMTAPPAKYGSFEIEVEDVS